MNTSRRFPVGLGLSFLVLLLLAPPASAQQAEPEEKPETGKKTIVIEIEDGRRTITVDGKTLGEEEADAYLREEGIWLDDDGNAHIFRIRPGQHRFFLRDFPNVGVDMPKIEFSEGRLFHPGEDHGGAIVGGLDDVFWFGAEGPDVTADLQGSMKERSEIARMDMESRRLAVEARRAEGAERERLEQELRQKLDEIFERKQALRARGIERLRERVDEAAGAQQDRQQARDEIIERRLKKLLGQDDKYDW